MNTAASNEPRIVTIEVTDDAITAALADGRTVSVPLAWSWRLSEATPHDHAISIADPAVTGRAVDVEALLAAKKIGPGDGERKQGDVGAILFARVSGPVDTQVAACHSSFHRRTRRPAVAKKVAGRQRLVTRLIVHVLAATGHGHKAGQRTHKE